MINLQSPIESVPSTSKASSTGQTTKVILVRHARTTYNEQQRYQGSSDESVLTAKGHQDAYATGLALQQYDFDAIYTSPLKRVRQTTDEILAALKAHDNSPSVYSDRLLTEICMFQWQGLSYQEVKEKFAEAYNCWQNTPHLFSFDNVYPVLELFEKAKLFWQKIFSKHRGQTILIVAHGGTNRALISTAIGLDPNRYHSLQQSNCGVSCLEFPSSNNSGKLKYLNATYHLGETLPKLKAGKTGWRWLLVSNANNLANCSFIEELGDCNSIDLLLTDFSVPELLSQKLATNYKIPCLSLSENHLFNWQQAITKKQKLSISSERSSLTTGLIIVSNEAIAQILNATLDTNNLDATDSMTVIHYPQNNNHSIIQGILPLTRQLMPLSK